MTSFSQTLELETEKEFLENLRARYENEGYTFTAHPDAKKLPNFLGSYLPDAIAEKPGEHIVIEVKRQMTPSTDLSLRKIRRLFDGHSDWNFHVMVMGSDPLSGVAIRAAAPDEVQSRVQEVHNLMAEGYLRPAFLMSWTLLEAAFRTLDNDVTGRPRGPGTVVQALAMNGAIEPDVEKRLRTLIDLRNRIVHGDLGAEPSTQDIEQLLSAIGDTLTAARSKSN